MPTIYQLKISISKLTEKLNQLQSELNSRQQEFEADADIIYSLFPDTKQGIYKRSGLPYNRFVRAWNGTRHDRWLVGDVWELRGKVANLDE